MWTPVAFWLFWRVMWADFLPIIPPIKDAPELIKKA